MRYTAIAVLFGAVVTGCASTGENLQRETARSIGNVRDSDVSVFDVDRGASNVRWKATAQGGSYECSADDMVRRVHCVKVASQQPKVAPEPTRAISVPPEPQPAPTATAAKPLTIKEAQSILNRMGFKAGTPDGMSGPATVKAIKDFQRSKGIRQTGQIDSATEEAMRAL